ATPASGWRCPTSTADWSAGPRSRRRTSSRSAPRRGDNSGERNMDFWFTLILIVDVVVALCIIGLVLLQHGKGADVGAAFGSGASGSLFGASGSANFLSRTTAILAVVFFLTTFVLAYLVTHKPRVGGGVMDTVKERPQPTQQQIPAPQATPDAAKASDATKSKANEVPK